MPLPRIYNEEACPLEGYGDLKIRLLVNPSGRELLDWQQGSLGMPGCETCTEENGARHYCDDCAAARERKGRAAAALFGPVLFDRPCQTTDQALAILDDDDIPSELFIWLLLLPDSVVNARIDRIYPNSNGSLTTPST